MIINKNCYLFMWSGLYLFVLIYVIILVSVVVIQKLNLFINNLINMFNVTLLFNFLLFFLLFFIIIIINYMYLYFPLLNYWHITFKYYLIGDYDIIDKFHNGFLNNNFELLKLLKIDLLHYIQFPFLYVFILITTTAFIFCLTYNNYELLTFLIYLILIFIFGLGFFFTDSILYFFLFYEFLLLPSFFILYKFAKTRRSIEASFLMFFWTQFGALLLIFSFLYLFILTNSTSFIIILNSFVFTKFDITFLSFMWLLGFGVKIPIWPFYGWLPKAHVEASTNFSIFLSGVLVKFAFFGLLKCLYILKTELFFIYFLPFILLGLIDSVFKLFYQIDLKKLIAYATVVEMHWLTFCVLSGHSVLYFAAFSMFISHAIMSSVSFLITDAIVRRFKTRLITEIHGINFLCPKLFLVALVNLIIFLGFPGSLFFISEFLFFTFIIDFYPTLALFLFIFIYLLLPTFFLKSWMNALFSNSIFIYQQVPVDLDKRELSLFLVFFLLLFWLGFTWQNFILV